jgi:hypothetical protein
MVTVTVPQLGADQGPEPQGYATFDVVVGDAEDDHGPEP